MTDYGEQGATPVDDAAVDDPPTVDEVMEAQRRQHPEQAATSTLAAPHASPRGGRLTEPGGDPATRGDRRGDGDAGPGGGHRAER
jgi:hypothetical protein